MIVPMARIQVAARLADRERLLQTLARVGAVHMVPVDPERAVASEAITAELARVNQALVILGAVSPRGSRPPFTPVDAVRRTLGLQRRIVRYRTRLARLRRRLEGGSCWGDVSPDHIRDLEGAGAPVRVFAIPDDRLGDVEGEVVERFGRAGRRTTLVAVAGHPDRSRIPAGSRPVPPPARSRREVRSGANRVERQLAVAERRLSRLARLAPDLEALRDRLEDEARWSVARHSALRAESLCAFQGWMPATKATLLARELARDGVPAAVHRADPGPDDLPPTLISYPRWARPMRGLFDILGTVPGYRELDVSGFFMLALPLFAGMIIGDAGYGMIFLLLPVLLRRRLTGAAGSSQAALLMIFGAAGLVWGAATGVWFGVTPAEMTAAGGAAGWLGDLLFRLQVVRGSEEQMRGTVIKICFLIGTTHLMAAHIRRVIAMAPDPRALAEIGWCLVLAAMLGLVWILFFGGEPGIPAALRPAVIAMLAAGLVLVVGFTVPNARPGRRIGLGLAGSLLPLVSAFGDTLSYIRLMAVGLATHYIAAAFNTLGASVAGSGTWLLGAPILAFGHLLNLALVLLAIFAHGVRLNMLEFSSNAGVQWTGYPYRPFALHEMKEV